MACCARPWRGGSESQRRRRQHQGRVFLIDNLLSEAAEALDPEIPADDDSSVLRPAPDGNLYRVWKVLWQPGELGKLLLDLGWDFDVFSTGHYFLWAQGARSRP